MKLPKFRFLGVHTETETGELSLKTLSNFFIQHIKLATVEFTLISRKNADLTPSTSEFELLADEIIK